MPRQKQSRPTVALIGSGNLASALGQAMADAGYRVEEVVVRNRAGSIAKARSLARRLSAKLRTMGTALESELLWLCVRDDAIAEVAGELAAAKPLGAKFAFHSSGALTSAALQPLRAVGARIASVHPLMTFVPSAHADLRGVWFGVEGDGAAVRVAARLVGDLDGNVLTVKAEHKALYHAWGALASPLLVAVLAAAEGIGRAAGASVEQAHEAILPLVQQTIANYASAGAAAAFSGPLRRGDVATIARHLEALRALPRMQAAYVALARIALHELPVKRRVELRRLLGDAE